MKIRNGFVSNSSSSSFVIASYEEITNVEILKELLFGHSIEPIPNCFEFIKEIYDPMGIATFIFDRLKKYEPVDVTFIKKELENIVETFNNDKDAGFELYKEKLTDHILYDEKLRTEKFVNRYTGNHLHYFYVCEIEDDSNIGAHIEHGDIFEMFDHLKFSHH